MLRRTLTYRTILRVLGIAFVILGMYWTVQAIFFFSNSAGSLSLLLFDIVAYRIALIGDWYSFFHFGGVLTYYGVGILFLGISTEKVGISYISLHLSIWLIGINTWYQSAGPFGSNLFGVITAPDNFFWAIMTVLCSLLLLILYVPTTRLLNKIYNPQPPALASVLNREVVQ
ncbi:hypothetical protein KDA_38950 [Dictyobacter alpinus]|uniref:Uncharacterized protein n=1 Tax=Dictyobacter alpinus TaxID=2014873 RepID=A0A402BAI8_9CHLR|nr:hypothetical protein [Dictyobacter alpinus]GCE28411.1 hypothetical protein KDA_38950 [Dictyobacter alpinus]